MNYIAFQSGFIILASVRILIAPIMGLVAWNKCLSKLQAELEWWAAISPSNMEEECRNLPAPHYKSLRECIRSEVEIWSNTVRHSAWRLRMFRQHLRYGDIERRGVMVYTSRPRLLSRKQANL